MGSNSRKLRSGAKVFLDENPLKEKALKLILKAHPAKFVFTVDTLVGYID